MPAVRGCGDGLRRRYRSFGTLNTLDTKFFSLSLNEPIGNTAGIHIEWYKSAVYVHVKATSALAVQLRQIQNAPDGVGGVCTGAF